MTEVHGVDLHLIRLSNFMPPGGHSSSRSPSYTAVAPYSSIVRWVLSEVVLPRQCRTPIGRKHQWSTETVQSDLRLVPLIWHPDLLKVLDYYGSWLAVRDGPHAERFRRWVETDYIPYFYRLAWTSGCSGFYRQGERDTDAFPATNTSLQTWRFRSDRNRGVTSVQKFGCLKPTLRGVRIACGFLNLTVAPGEWVELEIEFQLLSNLTLQILCDLVDERVRWFSEWVSEPITFELRVEDSDANIVSRQKGPFLNYLRASIRSE